MSKNVAASVRARLANHARASQRPFQEILQLYGLERFLYRFSQTPASEHFLLKGALLLRVWGAPGSRPTRDIDFLGRTTSDASTLEDTVRQACNIEAPDDGVEFDSTSVASEQIKKDADYSGTRVKFLGYLERARIPMQIDVGFGDSVYPSATRSDFPTILKMPAPRLLMYSRSNVIAEKFEAMISLGTLNSRYKDFYDIWHLSQHFDFVGTDLSESIRRTLERRHTTIVRHPVALQDEFGSALKTKSQWKAFLRRAKLTTVPEDFGLIQSALRDFLLPIAESLSSKKTFKFQWSPPGPWVDPTLDEMT